MSLVIVVDDVDPVELVLEPWGESYPVRKGSKIEVAIYGPPGGPAEIVHGRDRLQIWAWSGCTATLFIDGEDTYPAGIERPRVPDIPELGGSATK